MTSARPSSRAFTAETPGGETVQSAYITEVSGEKAQNNVSSILMCAISGPPECCDTTLMQGAAVPPGSVVLIRDGAKATSHRPARCWFLEQSRQATAYPGDPGRNCRGPETPSATPPFNWRTGRTGAGDNALEHYGKPDCASVPRPNTASPAHHPAWSPPMDQRLHIRARQGLTPSNRRAGDAGGLRGSRRAACGRNRVGRPRSRSVGLVQTGARSCPAAPAPPVRYPRR